MTEAIQDKIIDLWNVQKLTMTEIANEIGVTRNVISGLIDRLRKRGISLAQRTNHPHPNKGKRRSMKIKVTEKEIRTLTARRQRTFARPTEMARKTQFEIDETTPTSIKTSCTLLELTHNSCRFIVNDPKSKIGALYCGAMIDYRSYCAEHYRLCYQPSKGKDG